MATQRGLASQETRLQDRKCQIKNGWLTFELLDRPRTGYLALDDDVVGVQGSQWREAEQIRR